MKRKVHVTEDAVEDPAPPAGAEEDVLAGLRAESQQLRAELQEEKDRTLRSRAEFENYKRRVERDRAAAARQGKRALLIALVDLADTFDRALVHIDESPDSVVEGLHGMRRGLSRLLEAEGVTPFASVGHRFDPTRHEAIATVRDAGGASGTVVDEAGRGYLWNDELLRPARVRVAE
jgi:molecular chaperone GrpE